MNKQIIDIIREVKSLENLDVNDRLIADLGLTSLDTMIILSLIEERCNISFEDMSDIVKCNTINDLIMLVNKLNTSKK